LLCRCGFFLIFIGTLSPSGFLFGVGTLILSGVLIDHGVVAVGVLARVS